MGVWPIRAIAEEGKKNIAKKWTVAYKTVCSSKQQAKDQSDGEEQQQMFFSHNKLKHKNQLN